MSLSTREYLTPIARACLLAAAVSFLSWGPTAGAGAIAADAQDQPDQAVISTCTGCHGEAGNGTDPATPKLAGQKPSYLVAQLEAFRSGARKSDTMSDIAATLTDEQIAGLAHFFSRQQVSPDQVEDTQLAARGKRIYLSGGAGVPACAACHGPQQGGGMGTMGGRGMMGGGGMMGGMGTMRNGAPVPNLEGQHATYTVQQLDAFDSGARPSSVMGPIAARLGPTDRRAVAAYIAGLR